MHTFRLTSILVGTSCSCALAAVPAQERPAYQVAALESRVLTERDAADAPEMLKRDMWARLAAVNDRETAAWEQVRSWQDWQQFRNDRLDALQRSLGEPPTAPPKVAITRTIPGEGFRVECLVVSARPGLPVTANLYVPDPPAGSMPAIVICSSHHNPKTQGELQDMGMTWARSGCLVLVPDNLGHGERRQQPFAGREDYRWRYNEGLQLYLIGQSLVGWMVADLQRCLDVVLARPGVDPQRVILIGSVAGGGEPAAITAALDPRVTCSIPFNFGSGYAVRPSESAAHVGTYNWANWGDWESTRVLRLSGRDGFLPWVIVAGAAPRPLIFAKEFAFEADKDPAWQRIRTVYDLCGAADRVAEVHGYGSGSMPASAASHANNVGPVHRRGIYPLLKRWLNMPEPQAYQKRFDIDQLSCMTPEAEKTFAVQPLHEVAADLASQSLTRLRRQLAGVPAAERRQRLRQAWSPLLGNIEPGATPTAKAIATRQPADISVEKILLTVEKNIVVPMVLLGPPRPRPPASRPGDLAAPPVGSTADRAAHEAVRPGPATRPSALQTQDSIVRRPVVIAFAQQGKGVFLVKRADEVAALIRRGCVVCLPDLRGTGETSPDPSREFQSPVTDIHSQELKMGQTLMGSRLRDLRGVMQYLRTRDDIDSARMALWGESFAPTNPDTFIDPPLNTDPSPYHAEPMGAMLAILGALYEDGVTAVIARGGLSGYAAVLESWAFYVPHDAIVPGTLTAGDVCDLAAALAPLPLRLEGLVDGRNRPASSQTLDTTFAPTRKAYEARPDALRVSPVIAPGAGAWLSEQLAAE